MDLELIEALRKGATAGLKAARRLEEAAAREALIAATRPAWAPAIGFTRTDPVLLAAALEAVRRRICAYGAVGDQPCDCKYGLNVEADQRFSEKTGCPELRSVIEGLLSSVQLGGSS